MCGIFGIYNHPDASHMTYLGLYALQHRGQESSGIVSSDFHDLKRHTGMGLVNQVYRQTGIFKTLDGPLAIGHNRYSTTGSSSILNAQPILINSKDGQIAAAHNGNLINAMTIRKEMEVDGSIFTSTTDTEVIMHLIARSKRDSLEAKILDALSHVKGSYSILFLTPDSLYAARDHYGNRPLLLGQLDNSYVLSSESCSFDLIGATILREIAPGEMIRIKDSNIESFTIPQFSPATKTAHCIFEHIYFSRPDSFLFGENVDKIRRRLGRQLARECPVPGADLVMGVPDSSTTAALGYSEESKLRFDIGLIRNHYVGRTFILPEQQGRDFNVRVKFNPVKGVIKDKIIVLVDDSIVRATTMKKIISLVRQAGPKEIHLRISSPPIISPCYY
ncbi:MAG: amidophosphoribosyltransferase, partial [Chitinivibrionales bacterium]|nr:amidophosphoribosyltransferase [Chitinivibrionales bacterium]